MYLIEKKQGHTNAVDESKPIKMTLYIIKNISKYYFKYFY